MADNYIGTDVPVRFDVWVDGELNTPTSAEAFVYDPDSRYIATGPAKCSNGEVRYLIPKDKVLEVGIYTVIFKVYISGMGQQEHVSKVEIKRLPTSRKIQKSMSEV